MENAPENDIIDDVLAFEQGDMDETEIVLFFARLVESGMAWNLQGSYGRMAQSLIDAGYLTVTGEVAMLP